MDERIRLLEDLANPVRYRVLTRLEKGPATASELGAALGVSATALANHLRRLRERGLVAVRHAGRHAEYELAEPGLRELFSVLNELRDDRAADPPERAPSVAAGTCYDHLAGRLGVALFDALAEAGAIVPSGGGVTLGPGAEAALARFGGGGAGAAPPADGLPVPRRVRGSPAPRRGARRRAGARARRARLGAAARRAAAPRTSRRQAGARWGGCSAPGRLEA